MPWIDTADIFHWSYLQVRASGTLIANHCTATEEKAPAARLNYKLKM